MNTTTRIMPSESQYESQMPIVKVFGVGGWGIKSINHLEKKMSDTGVEIIGVDTDLSYLQNGKSYKTLQIGSNITHGKGTGGDRHIGEEAADEMYREISNLIANADMVFISASLGGGTGAGAGPIIAKIAKRKKIPTICVVDFPTETDGTEQYEIIQDSFASLDKYADLIIDISENELSTMTSPPSFLEGVSLCYEELYKTVDSIYALLPNNKKTRVNIDFERVKKTIMLGGHGAIGVGDATGDKCAEEAFNQSITSPTLRPNILWKNASGLMYNIKIPSNTKITHTEMQKIHDKALKIMDSSAKSIYRCVTEDDSMEEDSCRITIIATGMREKTDQLKITEIKQKTNRKVEAVSEESLPSETRRKPVKITVTKSRIMGNTTDHVPALFQQQSD